jgi:catechol 2,3-dioxygenase-like lactoylglutathione lyase family enzyme
MLHHVSLGTNDLARAREFYDAVLAVVGLRFLDASFGLNYGTGSFLVSIVKPVDDQPATPGNGVHLAFCAGSRIMVNEFHRVALDHGGSSDGAPGPRPHYNPNYYGAFVRDPDGNKLEAVTYSAV